MARFRIPMQRSNRGMTLKSTKAEGAKSSTRPSLLGLASASVRQVCGAWAMVVQVWR